MKNKVSGILFSVIIGIAAYYLAPFIPMVNSIVIALILGLLTANLFTIKASLSEGIQFSSKTILEIAIVFLGFGISFQDISEVGWSTLLILITTITAVLLLTFHLSKKLSVTPSIAYLIGFGTAICGSSAIASLAPKIQATKNEIGLSIAIVNLLGLVGMVGIPLILNQTMNFEWVGLFIGGTLHGVSNVAGAGYAMNEAVGDLAITIKLGRVALLAPAIIFFNFLINKKSSIKENLKLPYYIIGFMIATTLVSVLDIPQELIAIFRNLGKVFLTISMAAIGLNIQFKTLLVDGRTALRFGALIFIIQLIIVGALGVIL